jgi:hypothetical protein
LRPVLQIGNLKVQFGRNWTGAATARGEPPPDHEQVEL